MQRRRRRRTRSTRTYTLASLLNRQPKSLRKHPHYRAMIDHYLASDRLKTLRIVRRGYVLLDEATIEPESLRHFYRTYRLPANPFFPLFLRIKRDYLADRARIREARHRYIVERMRSLSPHVLATIKYLGHLERHYHGRDESPIWQSHLFPSSKKQADAYLNYATADWVRLFAEHLARLESRYRGFTEVTTSRVLASFLLELVPESIPPRRPPLTEISRTYRRLSLRHHPDRGGDPAHFIAIKRARDALMEPAQPVKQP